MSLVQHYEASFAPTNFVLIDIKSLVDAGLTVLNDLPNFCLQDSGVEVFKKKAIIVTLERSSQLLWIPEGILPLPIGREPWSEKTPRTCTYWVKTFFSTSDSLLVPHSVWTAYSIMNRAHLKQLQGQKAWKPRFDIFESFCNDRAAHILGFHDAPTLMDSMAEESAADEFMASATGQGNSSSLPTAEAAADALAAEKEAEGKDTDDEPLLDSLPKKRKVTAAKS